MLRLLWKELHEAKWYLLSLLTLPWVISLWFSAQKGIGPSELYALCFWLCTLPIAFLASTRVQKDMQPNQLSADWLPVNRWVDFLAKFAPGMIVVLLVPAWLRLVVKVCVGDPRVMDLFMTATASSIYTFTFAVSMFLPSLPAALVGVAVDMVACGWSIEEMPSYFPREVVTGTLAAIAATACIGVWVRTERSSIKRRASGALTGIAAGLVPVLAAGLLLSIRSAGGLNKFQASYRASRSVSRTALAAEPYAYSGPVVSPDGCYVADVNMGPKGSHVEIMDASGGRIQISDPTACPAAWLKNGALLFYTGTQRHSVHLNLFDLRTNRSVELASFPPSRGGQSWARPIVSVIPDRSGARVALMISSPGDARSSGLWVLDVRTKALHLIRAGISTQCQGSYLAWDTDSIVMERGSEYCRIPLDGSRPRYITDSTREARRD